MAIVKLAATKCFGEHKDGFIKFTITRNRSNLNVFTCEGLLKSGAKPSDSVRVSTIVFLVPTKPLLSAY